MIRAMHNARGSEEIHVSIDECDAKQMERNKQNLLRPEDEIILSNARDFW